MVQQLVKSLQLEYFKVLHTYGCNNCSDRCSFNSVTLNDIGTDADTDGFVDGISAAGK